MELEGKKFRCVARQIFDRRFAESPRHFLITSETPLTLNSRFDETLQKSYIATAGVFERIARIENQWAELGDHGIVERGMVRQNRD